MTTNSGSTGSLTVGLLFGAFSALLYTITNICLRQVANVDAVWVSTVKAIPTLLIVVPLLAWQLGQGMRVFTNWRDVGWLVLTAIGVQIFGNVAFQWALSVLGLTISVPIVLGTMLVGGAITGKWVLGEPVSRQRTIAVVILILATVALSYGAQAEGGGALATSDSSAITTSDALVDAAESERQAAARAETKAADALRVSLALAANIAAGIAYAFLGTAMRRSMRSGMSVVSTLFVLSAVGTAMLMVWSVTQLSWSGIVATDRTDLIVMICAGTFNALAFFAMARSLQQVPVLYVQMLNASQAAISAVAGWILFDEIFTTGVTVGLILTAVGLVVAGLRKSPVAKLPDAEKLSEQAEDANQTG